jgi:protoporphyrinogen/coproporphyrinogen III oxidase
VIAAPAFAAAGMIRSGHAELPSILNEFSFVSTAIISLGFSEADIPQRLHNHGCLHPRAEGGPVVACSWSSAKWPGRAPAGSALLRVFAGRAGDDDIVNEADDVLVRLARRELQEVLGITASPVFQRVHRWPRGMPQYNLGHRTRMERLDAALTTAPGLYVAGHSYHGIGIPDCIASGERAAISAAAHLRSMAA